MWEKALREEYHVQSVEGILIEVRLFIEELELTSELVTSDYAWNSFMGEVDGRLPEDKDSLLAAVDRALAYWRARGEPERNPFMGNLNRLLDTGESGDTAS